MSRKQCVRRSTHCANARVVYAGASKLEALTTLGGAPARDSLLAGRTTSELEEA